VLREHNLKARKVSDDMAKVVELMLGNGKVCSDFNFGHSITAHYANRPGGAERPTCLWIHLMLLP
jgi:hypothetical protein